MSKAKNHGWSSFDEDATYPYVNADYIETEARRIHRSAWSEAMFEIPNVSFNERNTGGIVKRTKKKVKKKTLPKVLTVLSKKSVESEINHLEDIIRKAQIKDWLHAEDKYYRYKRYEN